MMFWIVLAAVVVVGAALAWWPGGHLPGRSADGDRARRQAQTQAQINDLGRHGPYKP